MRDKRANKARWTSASFKNYRNQGNQLYEGWAHAQSLLRSSSRTARWGTITPKNKYDTRSFVDSYLMYVTVSYTRRNLTKSLLPLIVDASYFVYRAKKSILCQNVDGILLVAVVGNLVAYNISKIGIVFSGEINNGKSRSQWLKLRYNYYRIIILQNINLEYIYKSKSICSQSAYFLVFSFLDFNRTNRIKAN